MSDIGNRAKRILLVYPRTTFHKDDIRRCVPPLGIAYIAAVLLREGYEVRIVDALAEGYGTVIEEGEFVRCGLSDEEMKARIRNFCPDVVGVSCLLSTQYKNALSVLLLAKDVNGRIITLMGGSHPAFSVEEVLGHKEVDFVFLGEGENSILHLLLNINNGGNLADVRGIAFRDGGGLVINRNTEYIKDLSALPFPARELLDMERYFSINMQQSPYSVGKKVINIITSRGCPARCVFCTSTNFWGNCYRARSPEDVVAEIKMLQNKYGVDELQFSDDNVTLNKKRLMKILDGIKDLGLRWCTPQGTAVWALDEELLVKMKESGCYQLTFAIESGSQEVLDKIIKKPLKLKKVKPLVKKAQELGIRVHAFFICGLPGETLGQMQETYDFAEEIGFDSASFFVATPLIGSEMLDICMKNGYIRGEFKPHELVYKVGHIDTPGFSLEEVTELVKQFNKEYNKRDRREKKFNPGRY